MKRTVAKGFFLLFFSLVYIIILKIFHELFPELVYKYKYFVTGFYIFVFLLEGLSSRENPNSGFLMGFIGSLFGFFVSAIGLFQYINGVSADKISGLMEAWNLPLVGIMSHINFNFPNGVEPLAVQYLSILILVAITFIGSLIGSFFKKD